MSSTSIGYMGSYRLLNAVNTGQSSRLRQAYDDDKREFVGIKTLLNRFANPYFPPPKSNREELRELCKVRNVVERNFRSTKQFRRVFTRYDKLDETDNAFIVIAKIAVFMRN